MNVYEQKSQPATKDPTIAVEMTAQEEPRLSYPSDSYQKILDYRIAEIFLTTIVFGVIVLLRLHH